MAERCERCGGWSREPGEIGYGAIPKCWCIEAQREALESAAKMIEGQDRWSGSYDYSKALEDTAHWVRQHRPWEKPKAPRPKVSQKAVEEALRVALHPERLHTAAMVELARILDLEDD